jgi:L-aspartate oxidase
LVDAGGERFMVAEHELAELAPRDVVARVLWRRLEAGQRVFLDAREAVGEDFPQRFPTVFRLCRAHGIDPRRELMPVSPAAHFHMGGIATDAFGRASLAGLWACGEVASSGVHGANRLASNSLLEGLVYGARVAQSIAEALDGGRVSTSHDLAWPGQGEAPRPVLEPQVEEELTRVIRRLLWQEAGVVRRATGLRRAQQELRRLGWWIPAAGPRLRNLHTVAQLVVAAALERRESRGGHFRADFPQAQAAWRRRLFFTLEDGVLMPGAPWPALPQPALLQPARWPAELPAAAAEPLAGRVQA